MEQDAKVAMARHFNSQPHKEADRTVYKVPQVYRYFNSQPHKEADLCSCIDWVSGRYFNSQPHKEADTLVALFHHDIFISTHSLTRRLTSAMSHTVNDLKFQLTASQGG